MKNQNANHPATCTVLSSDSEDHSEIELEHKLISHGVVNVNRLYSEDVNKILENEQNVINENHLKDLKLYHHGAHMGNWMGEFIIKNNPYHK